MGRWCLPWLGRDHTINLNSVFCNYFQAKMLFRLAKEMRDESVPFRYTAVVNGDRNAVYRSFFK